MKGEGYSSWEFGASGDSSVVQKIICEALTTAINTPILPRGGGGNKYVRRATTRFTAHKYFIGFIISFDYLKLEFLIPMVLAVRL